MVTELIKDAPVKDELITHDGVVYFPKELMPPEPEESVLASARLGFKSNAVPSFLMKSKKLNLKLKFKKSKFLRQVTHGYARHSTGGIPFFSQRRSMQFGSNTNALASRP